MLAGDARADHIASRLHRHRDAAIGNYAIPRAAMGWSVAQIAVEFAALRHEVELVRA
jgi:hypothetical protein